MKPALLVHGMHGLGDNLHQRAVMRQLVEKFSTNPRKIVGRNIVVAEGEAANLSIIDPSLAWTVRTEEFKSKSKNSPFHGRILKGKAAGVMNNGILLLY